MSLAGKRVIVTGGSRGIGTAIALLLAERGCDVAITYATSAAEAESVVAQIAKLGRKGFALQADSGQRIEVQRAVDEAAARLGGLEILVNNAGIARYGGLRDLTDDDIDDMLSVNVRGVISATRAALAHLQCGGRIINIGSCLANRVPTPGVSVYAMTKSALDAFTQGLARDLGAAGITVNVVHPGPTDTAANPATGPQADFQRQLTATGAYGRPRDVAEMVAFLALPQMQQFTGSAFAVDGGVNA